jgi:ureidoglycolate lyase
MRSLNAEALTEKIFFPYGVFYDLRAEGTTGEVIRSVGEGYSDGFTKQPLIDRPGSLGLTCASAVPYTIEKMERHLHTREAMMCAGEPIAFLAAPACDDAPEEADVRAFLLEPGQVVVLERGIWHSPAFGIQGPAAYYWMAEAYEGEPTVWKAIKGGPVRLNDSLSEE